MSILRRIRPEPFVLLMTGAWVVGLFSIATAPLQDLWRPLLVALGIALSLMAVAGQLRSKDRWAVIGVGIIWLLVLGAWPLALGVALVVAWRLLVDALRRAQGRAAVREEADRQVLRVANALGVAAAIVAGLSLVNSGAIRFGAAPIVEEELPDGPGPSMYLVLIDGYPATETLDASFGYDNHPFEKALKERGFAVADAPSSNYNRTLLTLTSMLDMRHIDEIGALDPPRDGFAAQTRQLTTALNDARVLGMMESAGYETVSIPSSYGEAAITSADRVINTGAMTLFEEQFVRYSLVGRWLIALAPDVVADQHRNGVDGALDALAGSADGASGAQFVLAHVFSPHPPFVFEADGSPRRLLPCYPQTCGITTPEAGRIGLDLEAYGHGMVGQVEWLNGRLLEAVDGIVAADPQAVVVLFSDHGARFEEGPTPEHFRVFMAARTPGHENVLTSEPISLVNVLPHLLDAYFDAGIPFSEDSRGWAADEAPLELEAVP